MDARHDITCVCIDRKSCPLHSIRAWVSWVQGTSRNLAEVLGTFKTAAESCRACHVFVGVSDTDTQ